MKKSFPERIAEFNQMYRLPALNEPNLPYDWIDRLAKFQKTLNDELNEAFEIIGNHTPFTSNEEVLTDLLDWFCDIIIYCRSEALKYGLPIEQALEIIMDSNMSKLGANGQPLYDSYGKVLKGPNYWKPEPKLRFLIENPSYFPSEVRPSAVPFKPHDIVRYGTGGYRLMKISTLTTHFPSEETVLTGINCIGDRMSIDANRCKLIDEEDLQLWDSFETFRLSNKG